MARSRARYTARVGWLLGVVAMARSRARYTARVGWLLGVVARGVAMGGCYGWLLWHEVEHATRRVWRGVA